MNLIDFCKKEDKLYLLEEWDVEKNLPLTPELITHSSSQPVWWRCSKGHTWQTQLRSRAATLTRCPKCNAAALAKNRRLQTKLLAKKTKSVKEGM